MIRNWEKVNRLEKAQKPYCHLELSDPAPKQHFRFYESPNVKRVLISTHKGVRSSAEWNRVDGKWECVNADQPLRWLMRLTPLRAEHELERFSIPFQWLPDMSL